MIRAKTDLRPDRLHLVVLAALLASAACGSPQEVADSVSPEGSPSARPGIVEDLRADLAAERHPSDGGGRAWLASDGEGAGETSAVAGRPGSWTVIYEAGELGIAETGVVFFQVPPFWGWSTPQVTEPRALGFTEVSAEPMREGVIAETLGQGLLAIRFEGRGMNPGERLRIRYGAGVAGARADRYAERESPFWIGVDGDGDGVRGLVPDPPTVEVRAADPARLVLTVPSVAEPGEEVELTVAVLDAVGNAGVEFDAALRLEAEGDAALPPTVDLDRDQGGVAVVPVRLGASEGVVRIRATGPGGLIGESNPLVVERVGHRLLWGDLHGHSGLSDGTGTPEDYLRYAREVAALDVVALTDHDHWGMEPLSRHPEMWERIRKATFEAHEPGRFVALLGYEWTSWLYGHRHVLYFSDEGRVLSAVDPAYEHPEQLWKALSGQPALTFAHHSAGGPVATDWSIAPDPVLEPLTEIVSVHGSSEAADSPGVIYSAERDNFVRDALGRGYRLGFVGSGDGHDGHPGLSSLASRSGGVAAILAPELTRESILEALRARRAYATNGPRIWLRAMLDGAPMGADVHTGSERAELVVGVVGTAVIDRVDLVRGGSVSVRLDGDGSRRLEAAIEVDGLQPGEYLYVRAIQVDGGAAWSSPFFAAVE